MNGQKILLAVLLPEIIGQGEVATLGMILYRSLDFSKKVVKKAAKISEPIIAPKNNKEEFDQ